MSSATSRWMNRRAELEGEPHPLGFNNNPGSQIEAQTEGNYHRSNSLVLQNSVYGDPEYIQAETNRGIELEDIPDPGKSFLPNFHSKSQRS